MKTRWMRTLAFAIAGLGALLLATSCQTSTGDKVDVTKVTPRSLPSDFFTRHAVAYEGYRTSTSPGAGSSAASTPTQADIDQDLAILNHAGYSLLRIYNSSTDGVTELVLKRIKALGYDMKVQLGVWISGSKASVDAANQVEIAKGLSLANTYSSIVETISVGNETMVSWGMGVPALDMEGYIKQVRDGVSQPVTTDDNWAFFADSDGTTSGGAGSGSYGTDIILASIDFVSMHTYPFADAGYSNLWDYKQSGYSSADATATAPSSRVTAMLDGAIADAKANYAAVKSYISGKGYSIPIVIGETGWKAVETNSSNAYEVFMAHPVDQKLYLDRLSAWTDGPRQVFYFEAFDEPWKSSDDGWGLFDVDRHARFALYSTFPSATTTTVGSESLSIPANESVADGLAYDYTNALCWIAQATNGTITKSTYLTLADSLVSSTDVAVPAGGTTWYGWDSNPATASGSTSTGGAVPNGQSTYEKITTTPKTWGWGCFQYLTNMDDLSNFSSGHLKFYLRTIYPGKLIVGYATGSTSDSSQGVAYTTLTSGDASGFVSDGSWHLVSLAIGSISGWNKQNSSRTSPDLTQVSWPFFVADVYASGSYTGTGDTQSATTGQEIDVAYINWTQN